MVIEVRDYIDASGRIPYRDWVRSLDASVRARVIASVLRMEMGNFSAAKATSAGLSELRVDFGPGYRIYFGRDGDKLVLLVGGGTKRRQHADIQKALALWNEYKRRKLEEKDGIDA